MEMELDTPSVTGANAIVGAMLAAGDGPFYAPNTPFVPTANITIQNGVGTVTGGAQDFIYGLVHGINTVNGITYFNPFLPPAPGNGTDNAGVAAGLNLLDNPNVNGQLNPAYAFGSHQYADYNIPQIPNPPMPDAALNVANRTLADALLQPWQVPAVAAINSGMHAISVYGVQTVGNSVPNGNYDINGFYVHDPWTGYVLRNGPLTNAQLAGIGGMMGLGYNTFVSNQIAVGSTTALNGQQVAVLTPSAWSDIFTVSGPQAGAGIVNAVSGYKFEVEPQGPELPDAGTYNSTPLDSVLSAELNAAGADGDVLSDLAADPTLDSEPGFQDGSFDDADTMFLQQSGETNGEGDWLVPYDGSGGVNNVTGGVLIDADTGLIDEATWLDPSDLTQSYTLSEIDALFEDQADGDLPNDNPVPLPEPASTAGVLIAGVMLLSRRRPAAAD